jgi:DUF4097 and DUF4098 domain-containing protein YvlB
METTTMHGFDTPGSVALQVRIPTGRVVVETIDEPRTEIELVPLGRKGDEAIQQIDVSHDERGGRHIVSIEQRDRIRWGPLQISWGGDVEVRVKCPVGAELEFSGASADFRADGSYGRVTARTASGDIRLGVVDGRLEVKTASGDVELERLETEDASLVTVSGDVEVGTITGRLTLRTVSGDVELGVARGPVSISTTSGDVDLRALEAGELRIQSVSGDARVGIGRGTKIFVDATSVSGSLDSELQVGDAAGSDAAAAEDSGDIVPVHVKTVSGDVRLVRAS